jgi:fatty-acyl-CoA synthase
VRRHRLPVPDPIALARRAVDEACYVGALAQRGVLRPQPPLRLARMGLGLLTHGSVAGLLNAAALRYGDRVAVSDELGTLTYAELDAHANAIANGWIARGLKAGDGVAILCRNHRHFLEAFFAGGKVGAKVILLNTDFAAPQLREVAEREGTDLLVHDDEYAELLAGVEVRLGRWRAWVEDGTDAGDAAGTLASLVERSSAKRPPRPASELKVTILTSGTTGTPKGANRPTPRSLGPIGGLLGKVPFHSGQTMVVAAPVFHSLGFATMLLGIALGDTVVLRRRFSPATCLEDLARHRADNLVIVPVMLARMLEHEEASGEKHDLSSLSVVLCGGSQLGAALAQRALRRLGPVVYNLYGSTEVAVATDAAPADLALEPGTVGTVLRGSVVKIVDEDGREVPRGETGRIFVGNSIQFEGYTGGGTKETVDGLMSSGDVGHVDHRGLLFVDGRDDDMIVSGGENVFPGEIEELLAHHPDVVECAVVGTADEQFGQRLKAFVVLREGASLDEDGVKDHVRENLARYKVPREVVFLDELPRNPTGKVLKRDLR